MAPVADPNSRDRPPCRSKTAAHPAAAAIAAHVKVLLSAAGRRLLRHAEKLKLVATGVFTVSRGNSGSASKAFTLKK